MFFKQIKISYLLSIIVLSIIFCFYFPQTVKAADCCVHIGDFSGNNPTVCLAVPPGKDGLTYCRELGSWPDKIYNYDSNDCEKISSCPQYVFTGEQKPEQKTEAQKKIVKPILQIEIPGFGGFKETKSDEGTSWIGDYTIAIYKWSVSVIAILAVVMIMIAGFQWVLSRGNAPAISNAKARISGAFMGLVIILSISLFLGFINPNLTILKPIKLSTVVREEFTNNENVSDVITTTCPEASELEKIPQDVTRYNIVFKSEHSQAFLNKKTLERLLSAAQKLKNMPGQPILQVNNAYRTVSQQLFLYENRGKNLGCKPKTGECNCPHMSGKAVDVVCANKPKGSADPCQDLIKKAMRESGFCNLESEAWHFELPKASKTCF